MNAKKITPELFAKYDQFVATHPSGSFLQSRAWGNFQESLGNPATQYLVMENDEVMATAQLITRTAPKINQKYLYCAYGPLWENESAVNILAYQLKMDFPEVIFIRFEPKEQTSLEGSATLRTQPAKTFVTDLDQPFEQLQAGMHPKTRYNIKVAAKHGVTVDIVDPKNQSEVTEALQLFEQTGRRHGFKDYAQKYYQSMLSELGEQNYVKLYRAKLGDDVLATAVMVDFGQTRTYLFGGSSDKHKNVMAPYALHWQAMKDAKGSGLSAYDWWGLETATGKVAGFAQFKIRFGGNVVTYPPAIDLINKRAWYTIYNLLRKVNRLI